MVTARYFVVSALNLTRYSLGALVIAANIVDNTGEVVDVEGSKVTLTIEHLLTKDHIKEFSKADLMYVNMCIKAGSHYFRPERFLPKKEVDEESDYSSQLSDNSADSE